MLVQINVDQKAAIHHDSTAGRDRLESTTIQRNTTLNAIPYGESLSIDDGPASRRASWLPAAAAAAELSPRRLHVVHMPIRSARSSRLLTMRIDAMSIIFPSYCTAPSPCASAVS